MPRPRTVYEKNANGAVHDPRPPPVVRPVMRAFAMCASSFVLALIVGTFILPGRMPAHKPHPRPPKIQTPQAASPEMLPALPSLGPARTAVPSNQDGQASRLLKAGRYREAVDAYLEILLRRPQDRKAIDGLVAARRLQAHGDPRKLQADAAEYRRAIVEGRVTAENYTPQGMELLAEASLTAAHEIQPEHRGQAAARGRTEAATTVTAPTAPQRPGATRHRPAPGAQRSPRATLAAGPPQGSPTVAEAGSGAAVATPTSHASRPKEPAAAPAPAAPPPAAAQTEDAKTAVSLGFRRPAPVTRGVPSSVPTAPAEATPGRPSAGAVPDAYLLGPGDVIEVDVPILAVTVAIDPVGVITLPMLGPVRAAGKTPEQLASDLTIMYSRVLQAPSVTVFVRHRLHQ